MEASTSQGQQTTAGGGTDLLSRAVISIVACSLVTWQLAETANFRPDSVWLEKRRWQLGGTPLQWFLVSLMLLSALDGVIGVVMDAALYSSNKDGGSLPLFMVIEEVGVQLVLGKISQMILSLMIIGLGVNAWAQNSTRQAVKAYAVVATALGFASLFVRRLPAPLVLVAGLKY